MLLFKPQSNAFNFITFVPNIMQNKIKFRERESEAVQGLWEGLKAILLRVAWQQGQSSPVGDHPRSPDIIHKWPTFVTVDFLLVFYNSFKRVDFITYSSLLVIFITTEIQNESRWMQVKFWTGLHNCFDCILRSQ